MLVSVPDINPLVLADIFNFGLYIIPFEGEVETAVLYPSRFPMDVAADLADVDYVLVRPVT